MTPHTLTVYSTPTCAPCRAVKKRLDRDGILYVAVDLTEDAEALERIKASLGTPTVSTPLFRWRSEYLDLSHLPRIIREAQGAEL